MNQTDYGKCISGAAGGQELSLSYVDPFYALRYQFGMLLGVEDFETEQAYHRGKMRLHNAWLHRDGVVWGLGVSADLPSGELRVEPGLALDPAGHELHLDRQSCLSVPAWYDKNKDRQEVKDAVETATDGTLTLRAWVAMRFRACLTREVPALTEPCDGAETDTAFSRVAELADLTLEPGAPPPRQYDHHRLRVIFGLEDPTAGDDELGQRARAIQALPIDQQRAAYYDLIRWAAALDLAELTTALQPDGTRGGWFPGNEFDPVVLAATTLTLTPASGGGYTLTGADIELSVRPTLLSTSAMQELLMGLLIPRDLGQFGPRVLDIAFTAGNKIQIKTDAALAEGTVKEPAFAVASRPALDPAAVWTTQTVAPALVDPKTIELTLGADVPVGHLARVIARGAGPTPILGADDRPLAGDGRGVPTGSVQGQDFTAMLKRQS